MLLSIPRNTENPAIVRVNYVVFSLSAMLFFMVYVRDFMIMSVYFTAREYRAEDNMTC